MILEKVSVITGTLDSKRDLLLYIKELNQSFYDELMRSFIRDPLTLTFFEKDLINALESIAKIRVFIKSSDLMVGVKSGNVEEYFDSYESAFAYALGLLMTK